MKQLVCALCVMVILARLGGYQIQCCLQNERAGLLQIKSSFSSVSDIEHVSDPFKSWDKKSNCCEWERVECSSFSGHITHLFLNSTVWPHEAWPLDMRVFYSFPELRTLDLSNNQIASLVQIEGLHRLDKLQNLNLRLNNIAQLPDFLLNLPSLQVLDLSSCLLIGKLDPRLCGLRNIRELYFPNNQLHGNLPACLWNLTSLQVLDLLGNHFSGNLPTRIKLPSLEWLSIQGNNFQGKFSLSSLTNHSNLKVLSLSNNALQVEIEESLSLSTMQLQILGLANCRLSTQTKTLQKFLLFQSNLQYIDLSSNGLVGSFPIWLLKNNSNLKLLYLRNNSLTGHLQLPHHNNLSLATFDISSNHFSGKIPYHIGMALSALKLLQMSNNYFDGPIPPSLSNLTQLEILDLSNNHLSGEVPNSLFSYCSHLRVLVLSNNNLDGEIIPSNMNLSSLFVLSLDDNLFIGTIKESLKISTVVEYLDLSNNNATGELPSWIGSLSQLILISLARNRFHGNITSQICNMESLQYLDLSENRFTGEIPSCDCPSSLLFLFLSGNILTGVIPHGLASCSNLNTLNLARNQLSGGVPKWINMLSNLTILHLGDNQLQGELPYELCQLQHLGIMILSNNGISGTIPSCFQNLSFPTTLQYDIWIAEISVLLEPSFTHFEFKKHYVFGDDVERGDFKFQKVKILWSGGSYLKNNTSLDTFFNVLDLSMNRLTGCIPPELGELTRLLGLNFSHNHLSGPIPESFSKLIHLEAIDLSWNMLSGTIPSQLVDLIFLEVFNVSYNNLSGGVPQKRQFGTFDSSSYLGNPLLCDLEIRSCKAMEPPSSPSVETGDKGDAAFDLKVFSSGALAHLLLMCCLHSFCYFA